MMYEFRELLKKFREAAEITQQELANRSGLSRNTILNWEKGHRRPEDEESISPLIDALRLMPDEAQQLLAAYSTRIPRDHVVKQDREKIFELARALQRVATMPLDSVPPLAALPEGSRMPLLRNHEFVGREIELSTIAQALTQIRTQPKRVVITGVGGIGKTNLASEFVYRYGHYFLGGVFWLSFDNPAAIEGEISAFATSPLLGLDISPEKLPSSVSDRARLVMDQWESNLPRLLIFDNWDNEASLVEWQPKRGGCHIVITSQRTAWSSSLDVTVINLPVFEAFESVNLLRHTRPDLSIEDADAIAKELDHLPLALHLAGKYLKRYAHQVSVSEYLRQLRQPDLLNHASLQGMHETSAASPTYHDPHVARTFTLSFAHLDSHNAIDAFATRFLAVAAWLAPGEIISRELLLTLVVDQEPNHHYLLLVEDALLRLFELGLLEGDIGISMRLHRLLAHFVRMTPTNIPVRDMVEQKLLALLHHTNESREPRRLATWQIHLRMVTDEAILQQKGSSADLALALGTYLHLVGDEQGALYYLHCALKIRETLLGATHVETITIMNRLGYVLSDLGKMGMAGTYYEKVLAHFTQADPDQTGLVESLITTAEWFQGLGDLKQSRTYFDRALLLQEKQVGREHLEVAKIQTRRGFLLTSQGELELAELTLTRALAIQERELRPEHLEIAQTMKHLGMLLIERADFGRARYFLERTLDIRENTWKEERPNHPYIAASLKDLAILALAEDNPSEARPLIERALTILNAIREPINSSINLSTQVLGLLCYKEGNLAEARSILEATIHRHLEMRDREQSLPKRISHTIAGMNYDLGLVLQAQGYIAEAETKFRQVLSMRLELFGEHHFKTAQSFSRLAMLLQQQGKIKEAQRYLKIALKSQKRVLGSNHPDTIHSLQVLQSILQ